MEIHQGGLSAALLRIPTICKDCGLRICAKIIQRVIDLYNSKQYIDCAQPCSKLCEPSLEEGVEEVDVDDDIDEGESMADEVGKSIPGICFWLSALHAYVSYLKYI